MAKVNYRQFPSFDLNEACDHFDFLADKEWNKVRPFIVADGQDYEEVMTTEFDFYEVDENEYEAFDSGVKYAMAKINAAFQRAGIDLELARVDLVDSSGFMLVRTDDSPESFVKRVFKKPVKVVDSWV